MILKICDVNNGVDFIPLILDDSKFYCKHVFNGYDTLSFEIETNHNLYRHIKEENRVIGFSNEFLIKTIDKHSDFITVGCELNLDDWKSTVVINYRKTNSTIVQVIGSILPEGWSVIYEGAVDTTKRTTVEEQTDKPFRCATPLEVLSKVAETYSVTFNFDCINKMLYVIQPSSRRPSGEYFYEDFNLLSLGYNGNTSDFATRLYVYGKKDDDGNYMTIASINDGKEYVENNTYSDKVVCAHIVDERYTVKENLKQYGIDTLATLCIPVMSYECDVLNVGGKTGIYDVVTVIDKKSGARVNHQCVEYKEYSNHLLDKLTLSTITPSIQSLIKSSVSSNASEIRSLQSDVNSIKTSEIDNTGGYFRWVLNANNNPVELLILCDSDEIQTARKIYRWTDEGLSHSLTGINGTFKNILTVNGKLSQDVVNEVLPFTVRYELSGVSEVNDSTGIFTKNFDSDYVTILSNYGYTYSLFVQPIDGGVITSVRKNSNYFEVVAPVGTKFDWLVKPVKL